MPSHQPCGRQRTDRLRARDFSTLQKLLLRLSFFSIFNVTVNVNAEDVRDYVRSGEGNLFHVKQDLTLPVLVPVNPPGGGAGLFHPTRLLVRFEEGVSEAQREVVHRAALARGVIRDIGADAAGRAQQYRDREGADQKVEKSKSRNAGRRATDGCAGFVRLGAGGSWCR